jgi:hypothetical protein
LWADPRLLHRVQPTFAFSCRNGPKARIFKVYNMDINSTRRSSRDRAVQAAVSANQVQISTSGLHAETTPCFPGAALTSNLVSNLIITWIALLPQQAERVPAFSQHLMNELSRMKTVPAACLYKVSFSPSFPLSITAAGPILPWNEYF